MIDTTGSRWAPEGLARLVFPAPPSTQCRSRLQGLTVLCFPGPCPASCLQQMWFTGQGSLLKQLSADGNSFWCCRVPGTLCVGNGGHPLWSSCLACLHGHPCKHETDISVLYLFYSSGNLSAFLLAFSSPNLDHGMVPRQTFLDWVARVGVLLPQCSPWMT